MRLWSSLVLVAGLAQAPEAPPSPVAAPPAAASPQAPRTSAPAEPPTSLGELIVTAPSQKFADKPLPKLNLDPHGAFTRPADPTPYLRQRPVNGCKLMAGGGKGVMGPDGAAGGLVCAFKF